MDGESYLSRARAGNHDAPKQKEMQLTKKGDAPESVSPLPCGGRDWRKA